MGARRAAAALLVVTLTAACGDSGDPSSSPSPSTADATSATTVDAAALDGRSYASTSVEGAELVEGTTVEVGFEDETMSVWAGCNTLFGPFEVDGTTITWTSEPAATMMLCDPDLVEQDR